ncbi:hypothetical protein [Pseudomonas eucalypticola]|uniref:Uncharacterized protein n=1 Tax=Pseudomonas eucalypticola TaxID=2599595 RepID=A0A7D5D7F9_9PSED|nr:hypothetical protein [Pseudomonas eucalypticola]QKZ04693.1 hypothetical protein HWQ56_13215 [Pseudomonas eucalypticola]
MNSQPGPRRAGSLNPAFNDGHVTLDHIASEAQVVAMELTSEGGLLVLSKRLRAGFDVSKFTSEGKLDLTFAQGSGWFHENQSGVLAGFHLLASGHFIIFLHQGDVLMVSRYGADGWLDTNYAIGGRQQFHISEVIGGSGAHSHSAHGVHGSPEPRAIAPHSPGVAPRAVFSVSSASHLYLVLTVRWDNGDEKPAVVRLNANGFFDTSFHGTGSFIVAMTNGVESCHAQQAVVQAAAGGSSQIVLLVAALPPSTLAGNKYLLRVGERRQDFEFGTDGYTEIEEGTRVEPHDLWGDENSLRVIGSKTFDNRRYAVVIGFTANGKADQDFNKGEPVRVILEPDSAYAEHNIFYQGDFYGNPDARMVFAAILSGNRVAAVRLLPIGAVDQAFGEEGIAAYASDDRNHYPVRLQVRKTADHDVIIGHHQNIYWLLGH